MRLAVADAGNDPAGSTTRQAYDLLAEGFGAGVNGPLDRRDGDTGRSRGGRRARVCSTPWPPPPAWPW